MKPIKWNPSEGVACQGDVILMRVPDDLVIATRDEISPRGARLILAEGEVTGHHHAITLKAFNPQPTQFHDEALARSLTTKARVSSAKLYRDTAAVETLVERRLLTTSRLAIGFLIVDGKPVDLSHDEHNAIRIPVGRYYVGGQREDDMEHGERRVAD